MSRRVERVVVVGRNAAAWLSALAIHRSFARAGVHVRVIELPSQLDEVDVYPALPSLSAMHQLLGIDEFALLDACRGLPLVGQRFANWSGNAPAFIMGYDDEPAPGADLPFVQYWLKAKQQGLRIGYEDFSLGAVAARTGRVPAGSTNSLPPLGASHGYHFDARSYAGALKQLTLGRGIEVASSTIARVRFEHDRITAVELSEGECVEGDLFIDASGAERALIGRLPHSVFDSWASWFPCDRTISASGPAFPTPPAFSHIAAFRAGWLGLRPLQDRTAVTAVFNSRLIGEDEVVRQMPVLARMPVTGNALLAEIRPGAERAPWTGNCVAIGDTAISLEPLDGTRLHAIHGCLSHLITLFPTTAEAFPEAAAYNRIIARFAANMRDFQIAHYKLNRRFDEPLWDAARDMQVPATLERKIDLFGARGDIPMEDDESFLEQSWIASFVGHGLVSASYDPRVDLVPEERLMEIVKQRLRTVAGLVQQMPGINAFTRSLAPEPVAS